MAKGTKDQAKKTPSIPVSNAVKSKGSIPSYMMNAERWLRRIQTQEQPHRKPEDLNERKIPTYPIRKWGPAVCAVIFRDGAFAKPYRISQQRFGGCMIQFEQRLKLVRVGHAEYRAALVQVNAQAPAKA